MKRIRILIVMLALVFSLAPKANAEENQELNTDIPSELVYEMTDMEAFTNLEIDVVNTSIEIISGDHYGVRIYLSQPEIKVEDSFNITVRDNALKIDEMDWKNNLQSLFNNLKSRIVVTVPKVNELSVQIDYVNGDITVAESLKKLELDIVNGEILLAGTESYPTEIDFVNADVELYFDNYDANFVLEFVNGNIEILGDEISARLSEFRRTIGEGTHDIRIDAVNGTVVIGERAR